MKCTAYRWQTGEQKQRGKGYHESRREVGVTVLQCEAGGRA